MSLYGRFRNFQHFVNAVYQVIKYGYPARDLTVIGVTGTDGKTTTTHLIASILSAAGKKTALVSTVGGFFNGKKVETGFHVTTPDPEFLQPFLVRVKKAGITHVVMEATSHGLDQHRVLGCNFKVGVLTNITHEHLDYHKTFERYRKAKAKLFSGVSVAVLNEDDPSYDYMKITANPLARFFAYSIKKKSDLWASDITMGAAGTQFVVHEGKESHEVKTPLLGLYNVQNCLAAIGAVRGLGITWDAIFQAVAKFSGIPGRLERIDAGQDFSVFVDFAHTPGAFENLFSTLQNLKPSKNNKLIVVFGAPGKRDVEKRPMMGEVAARLADFLVLTTDDPRDEDPKRITDQITRGVRDKAKVWDGAADWRKHGTWCIRILDRGEAIAFAIQKLAKKGDIVVLCGQGHQKAMPIGKREVPWSDQEAARIALRGGIKKLGTKLT